ncbi:MULTISPECIES: hypothetical protein [Cupriavidus]
MFEHIVYAEHIDVKPTPPPAEMAGVAPRWRAGSEESWMRERAG